MNSAPLPWQPMPSGAQARRLTRLVQHAGAHVGLYQQRFRSAGINIAAFDATRDWERVPILHKRALVSSTPRERVDQRLVPDRLHRETTTGSTGQPFTQHMSGRYLLARNARFLRGLMAAGYRPWQRLMLLTEREQAIDRWARRWAYRSIQAQPEEWINEYTQLRPQCIYGCTTPLRLMAERLSEVSIAHSPALVLTTAEMLDARTRRLLESTFSAPVRDLYGLTELGLVAWQPADLDAYSFAHRSVFCELIPLSDSPDRFHLVATNLELRAAPIIRYATGDIVHVKDGQVIGFEGRQIDTIANADGQLISPYRVTTALQAIEHLKRFRLIEHAVGQLELQVETSAQHFPAVSSAAQEVLRQLLGDAISVDIEQASELAAPGTRKFRPVESHATRPTIGAAP